MAIRAKWQQQLTINHVTTQQISDIAKTDKSPFTAKSPFQLCLETLLSVKESRDLVSVSRLVLKSILVAGLKTLHIAKKWFSKFL